MKITLIRAEKESGKEALSTLEVDLNDLKRMRQKGSLMNSSLILSLCDCKCTNYI